MCYLDSNYGGRSESYNYQEYDICRQQHRQYWSNTMLDADPAIGRLQPTLVDWTGIADSAYTMAVHNGPGAPVWYHPMHDNAANEELNHGAEYARAVVEHQFGRIGAQWAVASDNRGPWHHVGNGGHSREGSDWGMDKSIMYFTVCARLTAMTQRMRGAFPRNPAKFYKNEYEWWEVATALRRIQEGRARAAM